MVSGVVYRQSSPSPEQIRGELLTVGSDVYSLSAFPTPIRTSKETSRRNRERPDGIAPNEDGSHASGVALGFVGLSPTCLG
jgi:hypothetical protein